MVTSVKQHSNLRQAEVLEALSKVIDPELGKDLVTLNMIKDIRIEGAKVTFSLVLTTNTSPLRKELTENSKNAVLTVPGIKEVIVETNASVPSARQMPHKESIPNVKSTIAIASGKGGVGKSTVAVNLALALGKSGAKTGILDADIYGPSIPIMMGINKHPDAAPDEKILPISQYGIKLMSVGFMLDEETPLIWRGPMVMQIVKQFLTQVEWGDLDYLVIDLPPGTGDAQLTIVQTIPLTGAVIVTTPQDVALIDARRAIKMFQEVNVPILGIIENMSYFQCPHCGEKSEIFSSGGGEKTSIRYNVPLLGTIPIDSNIRESGDSGKPIVMANPSSHQSKAFIKISGKIAAKISTMNICG